MFNKTFETQNHNELLKSFYDSAQTRIMNCALHECINAIKSDHIGKILKIEYTVLIQFVMMLCDVFNNYKLLIYRNSE